MSTLAATAISERVTYACGPVHLEITSVPEPLLAALHGLLAQYDAPWDKPAVMVRAAVTFGEAPREPVCDGAYLTSYRLRVNRVDHRLISWSQAGVWMEYDFMAGQARIVVPTEGDWLTVVEEVEQQFVLLLARAWAGAGWTPLHAGSLSYAGSLRSVLLCAPSGTGKSTLTAAMLCRGWHTLGDDKSLLRFEAGKLTARALAWRFHLHPSASRWLTALDEIQRWPTYSRWTDKRVVNAREIWPERLLTEIQPAAIVRIERSASGIAWESLDPVETMKTLVNQVVLPNDAAHARPLAACLGILAMKSRAMVLRIGANVYDQPEQVQALEAGLKKLLD